MKTIPNKPLEKNIKTLIKPHDKAKLIEEVAAFCEPNVCDSHCNGSTTNSSPDSEVDILF